MGSAPEREVVLSWSGGKDSALALQALQADADVRVVGLLTSITRDYDRISVHGVRRSLLEAQVARLDLPLFEITLDAKCTNEAYNAAFIASLEKVKRELPSVGHIAFGDLFLEDVRAYREKLLSRTSFAPTFPIWKQDTSLLAERFIADGFAARIVCVDTMQLDASFAGREFDSTFLNELPADVDACGERGEFHTFVSDGPGFTSAVPYKVGEKVLREDRFMYCDIL
jgi:uncharacterized protein (TIGR00290 family)